VQPKLSSIKFSVEDRKSQIELLSNTEFDLLVIGGGITGAGIALDAAQRGLKVALLEKKDYAWGTSSRSTKLIHGGLRYLKQMEFKLVQEVGTERAIVHRNARHIVVPEKMLLPITEGGSLSKNMSAWALWVYDWLAGVDKSERKKMLNAADTAMAEPLLRKEGLKAGGLYFEYRTDDARLTAEILKTAVEFGAICLNYAEINGFEYDSGNLIKKAKVKDNLQGSAFSVNARIFVNAAGPWVDNLRAFDTDGVKGKRLHLSKGVHLVIPFEKLPLKQSVYFDVKADKRMIFAIPRDSITYLGTTDTNFNGDINNPEASAQDAAYIIAAVNEMFPSADLKVEDVISSWAGLRPLIHQDGKSVSELSRKDEIFLSKSGLISIAGGKLTGYRKMAEKVVNLVSKKLGRKVACGTKNLKLSGADFETNEALDRFFNLRCGQAKQISASHQEIKSLLNRYGANIDLILANAFELYQQESDPSKRLLLAELYYCIEYEQVASLCDFLIRRSGRLYFNRPELENQYHFIAEAIAKKLNWTSTETAENMLEFETEYKRVLAFKNSETV
jgi:glycerol-3-phosphate dehydrogenase